MRICLSWFALFGFAALPLFAGTHHRDHAIPKTAPNADAWEKPIHAVLDAQIVAWNRGDIEGFMDGYWNSPEFIYIGNKQVTRGWQAMLDRYHQIFKSAEGTPVPMGRLELTETQIVSLDQNAALVWGTYQVTNPDGKRRGGLYTLVMRKLPEGWRTIYDRTTSEPLSN